MKDIAEIYYKSGLSVVALKETKQPMGHWKESQNVLKPPTDIFKSAYGIGIICGRVSGGLECIDVDCKYDVTGDMMERYVETVTQHSDVLARTVMEKTPSGGWHILYRCEEIKGNQKLAKRYATAEELKSDPNDKVRVLFETRGEGGYFMCAPTKGYEITNGSLENIPTITKDERNILIECAMAFNEVYVPETRKDIKFGGVNVFQEYDDTADVVGLLQEYGWTVKGKSGNNIMLKRPGDTDSVWSGGWEPDMKRFTVFSTSTVFEQFHGNSPSGVLCKLKFNGDWRECAKWLHERFDKVDKNKTDGKKTSELFSFVSDEGAYLKQVRDGKLPMGLTTGFEKLDEYWRLKESYLVCINGVDNVGKSAVMWYLYVLAAVNHGWNFLIYAGENPKAGSVYKKLMEFYLCKTLSEMSQEEYSRAENFIGQHFTIIRNRGMFTMRDIIDLGDKALSDKKYNLFLIDPYNSLYRDKKKGMNPHDYDYEALGEIRQWISDTSCSVHIICHSATEALRKYYPKDHPLYANLIMPPNKGDTEGGGKFSNRTDDFLTVHRHAQSKDHWMWTEIYNRKNRDNDTGGKQTPYDKPFRMKMNVDRTGFADENGYNPILKNQPKESILNYSEPLIAQEEKQDLPF